MGKIKYNQLFLKMTIANFLLFGILSITLSFLSGDSLKTHLTEEFKSKGIAISESLARSSVETLLNTNLSTIQSMVDQVKEIYGVGYIIVANQKTEIIAHTFVPQVPLNVYRVVQQRYVRDLDDKVRLQDVVLENHRHYINISAPILSGQLGFVHVGMDSSLINEKVKLVVIKLQLFMLGLFGIAVILSYLFTKRLTTPLSKLTRYAIKLKKHTFNAPLAEQASIVKIANTSKDEVGSLAKAVVNLENQLIDTIQNVKDTTAVKEKMESELTIAKDIQMGIIPKIFPPFPTRNEFSVSGFIQPAKQVGGDFYDFFLFNQKTPFCFGIGDVAGKGIPSSLMMAITTTLLRSVGNQIEDPAKVLTQVNNQLCNKNHSNLFVTLFFGHLHPATGVLTYSIGGHNPPLLLKSRSRDVVELESTEGIPLGMEPDTQYQKKTIQLDRGDMILLYTDGITDARSVNRDFFGTERLQDIMANSANDSVEELIERIKGELREFMVNTAPTDDMTLLTIQWHGPNNSPD